MKSLLERLDAALASARDPKVWVKLQAQKAAHFARVGRFGEAREIICTLRDTYASDIEGEGVVWVMFAEGLVYFFEDYDERAYDRLHRVRLLSDAFALEEIKVLGLVWLMHIEFNRARFDSVGQLLRDLGALGIRPNFSDPEFARLALNLGDIAAYCADSEASSFWYSQARNAAVAQGDDATTAAVLYNRPAMALFGLRLAFMSGAGSAERVRFVALEMEAAHGYQVGSRHYGQSQLLFSCQARLHLLSGEYVQAAALFRRILEERDLSFGFVSDADLLRLEFSYSLAMSGNVDGARVEFSGLDWQAQSNLNSDDLMMYCYLYGKVARLLDSDCDFDAVDKVFQAASAKLEGEQHALRSHFESLSTQLRQGLLN
jgi:hypothetical protein